MEQLIKTAQDNDILIVDMRMKGKQGAMSQCTDGMCIIAIDPHKVKSIADRKEKTVHELGHCMTGAFYDASCPVIPRGRCERRATAWAVTHTFTRRTLIKAIRSGLTELWQLADYFNVTEHFMKEMCIRDRSKTFCAIVCASVVIAAHTSVASADPLFSRCV